MKTLKGWDLVGGSFTDYAEPGDLIDAALYDYFIGVMFPADMSPRGFLLGEAAKHNSKGEAMFECFSEKPYRYCGIKTVKEFHSKELLWKSH